MNASIARTLTGADVDTVRQALVEAIESTESVIDSLLPPKAAQYTDRDAKLKRKWDERVCIYRTLLDMLGGPIDHDLTSFQEFTAVQQ